MWQRGFYTAPLNRLRVTHPVSSSAAPQPSEHFSIAGARRAARTRARSSMRRRSATWYFATAREDLPVVDVECRRSRALPPEAIRIRASRSRAGARIVRPRRLRCSSQIEPASNDIGASHPHSSLLIGRSANEPGARRSSHASPIVSLCLSRRCRFRTCWACARIGLRERLEQDVAVTPKQIARDTIDLLDDFGGLEAAGQKAFQLSFGRMSPVSITDGLIRKVETVSGRRPLPSGHQGPWSTMAAGPVLRLGLQFKWPGSGRNKAGRDDNLPRPASATPRLCWFSDHHAVLRAAPGPSSVAPLVSAVPTQARASIAHSRRCRPWSRVNIYFKADRLAGPSAALSRRACR